MRNVVNCITPFCLLFPTEPLRVSFSTAFQVCFTHCAHIAGQISFHHLVSCHRRTPGANGKSNVSENSGFLNGFVYISKKSRSLGF